MISVTRTERDTYAATYTGEGGLWNVGIEAETEELARVWIQVEAVEEAKAGLKRHMAYVKSYKKAIKSFLPWYRRIFV